MAKSAKQWVQLAEQRTEQQKQVAKKQVNINTMQKRIGLR